LALSSKTLCLSSPLLSMSYIGGFAPLYRYCLGGDMVPNFVPVV
jgi:hypothetical protein